MAEKNGQDAGAANQLSDPEVKRLLTSYDSEETTDELYSFGLEMVKEAAERYYRYDSKATKIAGYAGAVVALLVSGLSEWSGAVDWWAVPIVFGAAVLALVAAALGLTAITLREIQVYSPREWIHEASLKNPVQLRRYHIYTMYGVRQSFIRECHRKARRVRYAHWTLVVAGTLLLVALLDGSARRVLWASHSAERSGTEVLNIPPATKL